MGVIYQLVHGKLRHTPSFRYVTFDMQFTSAVQFSLPLSCNLSLCTCHELFLLPLDGVGARYRCYRDVDSSHEHGNGEEHIPVHDHHLSLSHSLRVSPVSTGRAVVLPLTIYLRYVCHCPGIHILHDSSLMTHCATSTYLIKCSIQ